MTRADGSLQERLGTYLEARSSQDKHRLRSLRRKILPDLRSAAGELTDRRSRHAAILLLQDWREASADGLPETDEALLSRLAALADKERGVTLSVPILLVDPASDEAVCGRLAVEILETPDRGRVWTGQPTTPDAAAAAAHAVLAATALLRRLGYAAEPGDLDVSWSTDRGAATIEGPSLGLALALAVLARATGRPLPDDVAVTGAVGVDGRIEPVAGVAAKARAASDAGLRRLVVPEPAADIDAGLELVAVKTVAEAADKVLGLAPRRSVRRIPMAPLALGVLWMVAATIGALDVFATLGYSTTYVPLERSLISDRVVLVTWDRTNGTGEPGPDGVDFTTFADHRSYRATHPTVIARLSEAGASVIGLDAWIRGGDVDAIRAIADAIRGARVEGTGVVLPIRNDAGRWDPPDPALVEAASSLGFASTLHEGPLGLERAVTLARPSATGEEPAWSMPLLMLAEHLAAEEEPIWTDVDTVRIGEQTVPTEGGVQLVQFPAQPDYRRYSYADVFAGRFDPEHFRDSIVILGAAQGSADRHRTPVGDWYGVEVQAAILDGLLGDRRIAPIAPGTRTGLIGFFSLALAGSIAVRRRSRRRSPLRMALVAGAWAVLPALIATRWMGAGTWWPWTDVSTLALAVFAVEAWRTRAQRRAVSGAG